MVQPWGPGSSDLASELLWAARSLRRRCMSHRHRPSITRHLLLWFMSLHRRRCMSGRCSRARHIEVIAANAWCENWVFLVRLGGLFFGFHGGDIPPALWTSFKLS